MGSGCQICGTKTTDLHRSQCCRKVMQNEVRKYFPERIAAIAELRRRFREERDFKIPSPSHVQNVDENFWYDDLVSFFESHLDVTDEEMGVKWTETEGMEYISPYYESVCSGCVDDLMMGEPIELYSLRKHATIKDGELIIRKKVDPTEAQALESWIKRGRADVFCPGCEATITRKCWEHVD